MFLYVVAFPDFVLVHVPTLKRESHVSANPDRWTFTKSKNPMVTIPDDGLPRHEGWAATASPNMWLQACGGDGRAARVAYLLKFYQTL